MRVILFASALVFAAGFLQTDIPPVRTSDFDVFSWVVWLSPVIPLASVTIRVGLGVKVPLVFTQVPALLAGIIGVLLTLIVAVFAEIGNGLVLVHGWALTVAVFASILLLSVRDLSDATWLAVLAFPVLVAIWSLVAGVSVIFGAGSLSNGRALCLSPHWNPSSIESYAALRGLSFYAINGGYPGRQFYFYRILLIESDGMRTAYYWSPQWLKFYEISQQQLDLYSDVEIGVMPVSPLKVCQPMAGYIEELSIW